jgi:hypothetical protein
MEGSDNVYKLVSDLTLAELRQLKWKKLPPSDASLNKIPNAREKFSGLKNGPLQPGQFGKLTAAEEVSGSFFSFSWNCSSIL